MTAGKAQKAKPIMNASNMIVSMTLVFNCDLFSHNTSYHHLAQSVPAKKGQLSFGYLPIIVVLANWRRAVNW